MWASQLAWNAFEWLEFIPKYNFTVLISCIQIYNAWFTNWMPFALLIFLCSMYSPMEAIFYFLCLNLQRLINIMLVVKYQVHGQFYSSLYQGYSEDTRSRAIESSKMPIMQQYMQGLRVYKKFFKCPACLPAQLGLLIRVLTERYTLSRGILPCLAWFVCQFSVVVKSYNLCDQVCVCHALLINMLSCRSLDLCHVAYRKPKLVSEPDAISL